MRVAQWRGSRQSMASVGAAAASRPESRRSSTSISTCWLPRPVGARSALALPGCFRAPACGASKPGAGDPHTVTPHPTHKSSTHPLTYVESCWTAARRFSRPSFRARVLPRRSLRMLLTSTPPPLAPSRLTLIEQQDRGDGRHREIMARNGRTCAEPALHAPAVGRRARVAVVVGMCGISGH